MKTDLYAVYEATPSGDRLRAVFPPSNGGCDDAIDWGDEHFDVFHAADPRDADDGDAYLAKVHGVHVGDDGAEE